MRTVVLAILLAILLAVASTAFSPALAADGGKTTILVAAAASLRYSYEDELIPMFQRKYPWITVEGTYDSSGKLQAQIENGLAADVFMSAAMRQMNALADSGYIAKDSVIELLENRIVLIQPASARKTCSEFTDILNVDAIAIGDPDSVPAGQYAKEAFASLGIWEKVLEKSSLGTNVTEVLNWVGEGSADAGVVYATDASINPNVKVVAQAPEGSLKQKVVYPVGILAASKHPEEAGLFVDFLASGEGLEVFRKYGFTPNK